MRRLRTYGNRRVQRGRTEIQPVFIQAWNEGWRPNIQKTNLPPNSLYDLSNVVWNDDYTISKRSGHVDIIEHVTGLGEAEFIFAPRVMTQSGLFPQYSQQILYFNDDDGALFYNSLGELWAEYLDPGEGSDLIDSGHGLGGSSDGAVNRFRVYPVAVATYDDKIYMTTLKTGGFDPGTTTGNPTSGDWATVDGDQAGHTIPIIYDVTNTTFDRSEINDLDGVDGGIPGARCLMAKYARLFAGNVYKGGVYRYPSRIYWSGTDVDPTLTETWDENNYIDVGADDGQEIVAMLSFGDQILIFKNQSIWTLVGTDDTTFALYQLDDRLGTEATYAVAAQAGVAYFLDERTGIWSYDGAQFAEIGKPINDKLIGELNREAAYKCNIDIHDNILYVSIPVGTQSTADVSITYAYNIDLGTWTRHTFGIIPSPFPMYSDLQITGPTVALSNKMFGGKADTGLFIFNEGTTDDGTGISAHITTPWFNPGNHGDFHRLRRIEVLADEGDGSTTLSLYRDLEFDTTMTTVTYDPAAGTENVWYANQAIDQFLWSWLCIKADISGTNDMNLYGLGLTISTRPNPRGINARTGYT